MGAMATIEIDLATRPDCSLIAFVDDVAQLVVVIPMSQQPPAIGEQRLMTLVLPSGGTISGKGEVRYHRTSPSGDVDGCGIAFVAIGPPQRELLEAFVRATTSVSRLSLPPATRRGDEPRRTHERIPAQIDVQVERPKSLAPPAHPSVEADVTFDSEHNFYAGFSENIGDGGLFIQSWAAHNVGDRLTMRVTLPDSDQPVEIVGEVRWMRTYDKHNDTPPGIGVAFVNLKPDVQHRIESFVQQRRPLFYDD